MAEQQLTAGCNPSPFDHITTDASFNISTQKGLQAWIYWHYCQKGFQYDGKFKSLAGLKKHLFALNTGLSRTKINRAIQQ
jgi:hypothetical protein